MSPMLDIAVLVLFIVISISEAASIYFNSTNALAYIQFFITVVGFFSSLKELRPSLLGGVKINVNALRIFNAILLIVIITLQTIILSTYIGSSPTPPSPTATLVPSSKTIKIASEFPTSGFDTTTGRPLENAVKMAIDDANQNDLLHGYKLELMHLDDVGKGNRSDPDVGVQNLNTAITDNLVAGVVGPYYSRVAKELLPIANQAP